MNSTIANIGSEITSIISSSKKITPKLSEQEKINNYLDSINTLKSKIKTLTQFLQELDRLLVEITWLDLDSDEDERLLRDLIETSKFFHSKSIQNFAEMKKSLWRDNICRSEISNFKEALDDFEDSVLEVEEIFFSLRKDDEFNNLMNSL